MRFATTDRVFSEDIAPTDHEGIRRVLHKILDEQIDKYIRVLAVDLKHSDRIATVDIRTFVHKDDKSPSLVVRPAGAGVVQGVESKIIKPRRDRRLSS